MSKNNKVNRDHYVQRGRLTPDEAAREMKKQREMTSPAGTEGKSQGFQNTKPPATAESRAADADEDDEEGNDEKTKD